MVWQRARKPEQIEQRRLALLDAAAKLFEQQGFDKVSLNAIARAANISKANIYRYFESREELFLHLLLEDFDEWLNLLERELAPLTGSEDDEAVARAIVTSMMTCPRLGTLMSVLGSVLERNVTVDIVVWFKTTLLGLTQRLLSGVQAALPTLSAEDTMQFVSTMYYLVAGMWHAGHPSPAVKEALERPELTYACVDFEQQLQRSLVTTLRGLRAAAR